MWTERFMAAKDVESGREVKRFAKAPTFPEETLPAPMMRSWLIGWNLTLASSYSMNGVVPQMPHTLRVRGSNEVRPVRNDRA